MILTAHQPAYLPWLGYFDNIIRSDVFIFLDSVQFEKNSFTNRNKIKTPQGPVWLTIPMKVKGHLSKTILEMEIDNSQNWRKKHLNAIYLNYKKLPRFAECYNKLELLYQREYEYLAELCWDHLMFRVAELNIRNKIVRCSELSINKKKSELILDLCKYFGSDRYISGALGKDYLNAEEFRRAGISVEFQEYRHPVYPQLWGDFVPYMSIVDFWLNVNNAGLISQGN